MSLAAWVPGKDPFYPRGRSNTLRHARSGRAPGKHRASTVLAQCWHAASTVQGTATVYLRDLHRTSSSDFPHARIADARRGRGVAGGRCLDGSARRRALDRDLDMDVAACTTDEAPLGIPVALGMVTP